MGVLCAFCPICCEYKIDQKEKKKSTKNLLKVIITARRHKHNPLYNTAIKQRKKGRETRAQGSPQGLKSEGT